MMDVHEFEEQVLVALSHLYDHSFLLRHPLARLLGTGASVEYGANSLRRLLLDAIQDLKPPRDVAADAPAWRRYQYLYLRYVEAKPVTEIARGLAVSDRQTRRRHREALTALCEILGERLRKQVTIAEPGTVSVPDIGYSRRGESPPLPTNLLDAELERIHAADDRRGVDVSDVVSGAADTVTPLAHSRGMILSIQSIPKPVRVQADRVVLREALLEALVYAICTDGGMEIDISVDQEAKTLRLRIRIRRARQADHRPVDHTLPDRLAEADRLLRTQQGSIEFSGGGALVQIDLVLHLAQPETILIVDDNPDMLSLFRRFLSGSRYRPLTAQSGDDALRWAREAHPDCIVLDVMMPERDGWEILQSLRSDPVIRGIPILVCTVLQQNELASSLGASGFLAKPVTQRSLLDAVERCSRARR